MNLKLKPIGIFNYDFKIGKEIIHMPILNVACVTMDEREAEIISGFLSPFRGYKFQVSATYDGQNDLGSSDVVGLANLRILSKGKDTPTASTVSNCSIEGINKIILSGLMLDALTDFLGYPHHAKHWAVKEGLVSEDETLIIDASTIRSFKHTALFKEYVTRVYHYLWNENNTQKEW